MADWGDDPIQSMSTMPADRFHTLLDKTFGAGKWKITSGYRSPEKEDELRREGAGTVPKGDLSAHSEGTAEGPGAYDVEVPGLSAKQVADKLANSGAKFRKLFPEGAHGNEGAHLHVEPYLDETAGEGWGDDPIVHAAAPPAPPAPKPGATPAAPTKPSLGGQVVDAAVAQGKGLGSDIADRFHQAHEAFVKDISPPNSLREATQRAVQGGGAAAALPILNDVLGGAASPIMGALDYGLGRPVEAATGVPKQTVGNYASLALGGEGAGLAGDAGLAARAKAAGVLPETLRASEAAARKPNSLAAITRGKTAQEKAEAIVAKRIHQDSGRAPTAQEMLDHADRTPDKHMTLMDVGGPRTRGLAGTVARSPKGEGGAKLQRFLTERSEAQGPRLEADIQRQVGAGSSRQTIKSLRDAQKAASSPLYEDAFEANPVIRSSVVDQIVRSKQGAGAWQEAQDRAKGWVVGTDKPIPDKYSLRTLDQLKQVFDDKISVARRQGNNGEAALYKGLKDRLVGELDTLDRSGGLYGKARKTFSDLATSQDAVDFGRGALKMNAEDIDAELRGMSPGDRELARLGLAEALRDKVRATDVGRNAATKLARNRALQDQIAPFFRNPKAQQRFLDSALAEDTMFRTDNEVTKGSQTAARQAEDSSENAAALGHGARAAHHLVRGNLPGAAISAGRAAYEVARRPNPEVGAHVADILTQPVSANTLARAMLMRREPAATPRNYLLSVQRRAAGNRYLPPPGQ